jgi:hypothetical protein
VAAERESSGAAGFDPDCGGDPPCWEHLLDEERFEFGDGELVALQHAVPEAESVQSREAIESSRGESPESSDGSAPPFGVRAQQRRLPVEAATTASIRAKGSVRMASSTVGVRATALSNRRPQRLVNSAGGGTGLPGAHTDRPTELTSRERISLPELAVSRYK